MISLSDIIFYFLGLQFILFGLNGFFHFLRLPPAPKEIDNFMHALEETRFMLPTIKLLEIIAGILCLVPNLQILGLFLLAPIVFNVVGLHLIFNRKRSWIILLQVLLPYSLALYFHSEKIRQFLF